MKILYIVHQNLLKENSGTPVVTNQYANLAIKKNCEVCILSADDNLLENSKLDIINQIYYMSIKSFKNWSTDAFLKKNNENFLKINLPFIPDIIHILDWVKINPEVLRYLTTLKKPIIRHFCGFEDLCYYQHPFYKNIDHSLCTEEITPKMCSECISTKTFKDKKLLKKIKSFIFNEKEKMRIKYFEKLIDRKDIITEHLKSYYSHLIFPSEAFSKYFFSHFKIEKAYSVIQHGIKKNNEINLTKINSNKINFIYTGGRAERKGWKIIEEAFSHILKKYPHKLNLRIYGHKKKTSKSSLKKYPNVEFFESFSYRELDQTLQWADFGILPSHFETYGLVIREYIHNNVIPITSNAFGANEVISNNKNGIILKENNSTQLINTIENILNNQNSFFQIRENLKKTEIISNEFEFEKIFKIYQNYLN